MAYFSSLLSDAIFTKKNTVLAALAFNLVI